MTTTRATLLLTFCSLAGVVGCRTATVVQPKSADTTTVVTVEEKPRTQPSDPGLVVDNKD